MAGLTRAHRPTWSMNEEGEPTTGNTNTRHESIKTPYASIRPATTNQSAYFESRKQTSHSLDRLPPQSRRTLRPSQSVIVERRAYPLPDPSQFEDAEGSSQHLDLSDDILHPMQSLMRSRKQDRESVREEYESRSPPLSPAREFAHFYAIKEQPSPSVSENFRKEKILKSFVGDSAEVEPGRLQHGVEVKEEEEVRTKTRKEIVAVRVPSKVVVVYDGEKKFTTAPVDVALNEYATTEGDAIIMVAYLQHVMSPLGAQMLADVEKFSGVNEKCLEFAVSKKEEEIRNKLQATCRLQVCQQKKIQLEVKVLPGANPRALVVREIQALQGTCAIFDKNAMKDRSYYVDNLSCHILRLRSDGRSIENVSLFGQVLEKSGSITSQQSDTSSDSSMSSEHTNSASIWSKIKNFGSRRNSTSHRHSHVGRVSMMNSSRRTSNLGTPPTVVQEEDAAQPEIIDKSFSFDNLKSNGVEAYVYAAAGLDAYGPYARNGGSFPTALAV